MTAKLALFKRISALEALPTTQRPLKIVGGLPVPLDPCQASRATVKAPSGHVFHHTRRPNESVATFIGRISQPGSTIVLGGLPPLPLDVTLGTPTNRHSRTDLLVQSVDGPEPLHPPA
jgi:hypothetical protein